jgi:hypothetical protein
MKKYLFLFFVFFIFCKSNNYAQSTDNLVQECEKYMQLPFIFDGQQYISPINGEFPVQFSLTFYGGVTYRVSVAANNPTGELIFTVFDKNRNILFSNKNYDYAPFWDFKINNTIDCVIELHVNEVLTQSATAVMRVGFKTDNSQ